MMDVKITWQECIVNSETELFFLSLGHVPATSFNISECSPMFFLHIEVNP